MPVELSRSRLDPRLRLLAGLGRATFRACLKDHFECTGGAVQPAIARNATLDVVLTYVGPLEGGSSSPLLAPPRGSRARSIPGGVLGTRDPHRILFVTTCYRPDSGGGHAGEWNTVPRQTGYRPLTDKRYKRRGSGRTYSAPPDCISRRACLRWRFTSCGTLTRR